MINSFAALSSNRFTRKWAGSDGDAVDPYISGYFFTHFSQVPSKLPDYMKVPAGPDGITTVTDVKDILHGSCLAVTIPGGTVNRAEFTGLGGIRWGVPTNVEFDNTVTFRWLEFSGLPILSIMHGWVRMIRDYQHGTSDLTGDAYTKSNYAGTAYYWTTKPDGYTPEYYACLSGLFPLKDPTEQYGGDLTAYDKLELDIDFNCDYIWHESWVKDMIADFDKSGDIDVIAEYDQD